MIKVAEEFDLETNEFLDDICELVELYEDIEGNWSSFCRPSLTSPENLSVAMVEVMKDGINTWFWENGTFRWEAYVWGRSKLYAFSAQT